MESVILSLLPIKTGSQQISSNVVDRNKVHILLFIFFPYADIHVNHIEQTEKKTEE